MEFTKEISYELLESEFQKASSNYEIDGLARLAFECNPLGLFLEFGVFKGGTINQISKALPDIQIHGFDTFKGLPSTWAFSSTQYIGREVFDIKGILPEVNSNVKLYPGLIKDTFPEFLHPNDKVSFIHVDCDLYESTVDIFTTCEKQLSDNCVLAFDELGCGNGDYEFWRDGEAKAFIEMIQRTGYSWKFLCRHLHDTNRAAIQIKI